MTKEEALAMDLALEALEKSLPRLAPYGEQDWLDSKAAITAIKQARSAPVQEPVCKECNGSGEIETGIGMMACTDCPPAAQRQWVGLTDEQIKDVAASCMWWVREQDILDDAIELARAIEAKLKEKNT
jgi:hypothetical protein